MPSLWFVVPAHGRLSLAAICLRQLRRTCDALSAEGIEATAVIIADDENLDTARELGFGTIERDNRFLSRRFNDGIQLACDPSYNPRPADYVVPCGSDDWVDYRIFRELPPADTVLGFQRISFVREDGLEISSSNVDYVGGCGIRVYPRQIMAVVDYRPADEDRVRACDTSILTNVRRAHGQALNVVHADIDYRQIVDWKSPEEQLNSYQAVSRWRSRTSGDDPFHVLADIFPTESLREMAAHYERERELVPA
jgi:hypothetical protein